MSWDVSIFRFARQYASVEEIPEDETPLPLAPREEVHRAVTEFFPGTNWKDPAWGQFDSTFGSVEFNIGKEDPVGSFMLHVRASNEIVAPILAMCRAQNWLALDLSTGEFLNASVDPTAGLEGWRAFRNRALKGDADSSIGE